MAKRRDDPPKSDERKERVLHTRVPVVLEEELKRFAGNLRVPVSNLIRTILEDAVTVADRAGDRVEKELRSAASQLEAERRRLRAKVARNPLAGVYAFQPVVAAVDGECARCRAALRPGDRAFLGITDGPARRVFVCSRCVPNPKGGTP